jgi:hypothetical protein
MTAEYTSSLHSLITSAQTVCVFFPSGASTDVVLSAVTLARGVAGMGKSVTVGSPTVPSDQLLQFAGVKEVSTEIGNKNLDVSFPYQKDQVDKVSYHIDEEAKKFHLVVQPKKGVLPLNASDVQFTLTGAEADLIITVAVDQLQHLEQLYIGYEQLFDSTPVVSIHTYETSYGMTKLSTTGAASFGEVIAYVLQNLEVQLDAEMATNLLVAIESATQTFRSMSVTPQTFEIAGKLLSLGARRVRLQTDTQPQKNQGNQSNFASMLKSSQGTVQQSPQRQPQRDKDKQKNSKNIQTPSQYGGVSRS